MKYTMSVLVENHPGVLSRVSGLFSRRGFNIDSLAVGVTEDPAISRMTIVVDGDEYVVEQLDKQLNKVIPVIKVKTLKEGDYIPAPCPSSRCRWARPAGGDHAGIRADGRENRGCHPHHDDPSSFQTPPSAPRRWKPFCAPTASRKWCAPASSRSRKAPIPPARSRKIPDPSRYGI